jgi:hypothetical protein
MVMFRVGREREGGGKREIDIELLCNDVREKV